MRWLHRALLRSVAARYSAAVSVAKGRIEVRRGRRAVWLSERHWIYCLDIIRSFEQYWASVAPETVGGVEVVDYSQPRFHVYRAAGVGFWLNSIAEEATAIEDYFASYRPVAGDVVFDLGANCGVSTYHLSRLVGTHGRVFAFEPDPANYSLLLRNIEHHQLHNVVPINKAVGATTGRRVFHDEGNLGSGFADLVSRPEGASAISVAVTSLADAVAELGVERLSFVKMDIEGAELEVVEGSLDFLRGRDVAFAIDTNHVVDGELTYRRVEALFRKAGYDARSSNASGFWTTWARRA
jgi:FkbM family methyltransferase